MKRCAILIALLVPTVAQAQLTEGLKVRLVAGVADIVSNMERTTLIAIPVLIVTCVVFSIWLMKKEVDGSKIWIRNWFK